MFSVREKGAFFHPIVLAYVLVVAACNLDKSVLLFRPSNSQGTGKTVLIQLKEKFQSVSEAKILAAIGWQVLSGQHPFDQDKEHFLSIGLNTKLQVKFVDLVSLGTLDRSLVHPRETFRHAVHQAVRAVAFVHNHPSGDVTPSREDVRVTERLIEAGKVLGIDVVDNVIIGDNSKEFFSFREERTFMWR